MVIFLCNSEPGIGEDATESFADFILLAGNPFSCDASHQQIRGNMRGSNQLKAPSMAPPIAISSNTIVGLPATFDKTSTPFQSAAHRQATKPRPVPPQARRHTTSTTALEGIGGVWDFSPGH
jgi:hypothetical protein